MQEDCSGRKKVAMQCSPTQATIKPSVLQARTAVCLVERSAKTEDVSGLPAAGNIFAKSRHPGIKNSCMQERRFAVKGDKETPSTKTE
jgi:hypothetical protein